MLISVLAFVFVLGLVGCSSKRLTFDIGDASQIKIFSSLTGDEVIISDEDFIKDVTQNINSLTFEKTGKEEEPGYAYILTWMDKENNEVASLTITEENGHQISYDGYYYKVEADLAIDMALIYEMLDIATSSSSIDLYCDCVVGLLPDKDTGSDLVIFDTSTWTSRTLLTLSDVTPDNYAAVSSDGKYIAYTTWDDGYVRRYIKVLNTTTGDEVDLYRDTSAKTEVIDISWMPDNKTLLFIVNDSSQLSYQEIRTLNVETLEENLLVKGEVWKVKTSVENNEETSDYYLKGADTSLPIKECEKTPEDQLDSTTKWGYYLSQDDLDKIYQYYGGSGTFDRSEIPNSFYVDFSRPRVSDDGTSIIYSATLRRNSALGFETPLWICSAIWQYNTETQKADILYAQSDRGAVGRVDWLDENHIAFVTYYDFTGGRDSINVYKLNEHSVAELFPYTDEHYNNVTLLPIGQGKITFTSSPKDAEYSSSSTIEYSFVSGEYKPIDVQYKQDTVLLENFNYTKILSQ